MLKEGNFPTHIWPLERADDNWASALCVKKQKTAENVQSNIHAYSSWAVSLFSTDYIT
jgi:hypothetical protein